MTRTNNTLQDIANLLLEHSVEHREDLLIEELNRVTIYRSNCWDIINELRPSSFYCSRIGEANTSPEALAWSILYDRFLNEYGILLDN